MLVFNGTPHEINIVSGAKFNDKTRKYMGGEVIYSLPTSGVLNAHISTELIDDGVLPGLEKKLEGFDPLPKGCDIYIVSMLYATALLGAGVDVSKVYTVADPVMSEDGKTFVGCRGICGVNIA